MGQHVSLLKGPLIQQQKIFSGPPYMIAHGITHASGLHVRHSIGLHLTWRTVSWLFNKLVILVRCWMGAIFSVNIDTFSVTAIIAHPPLPLLSLLLMSRYNYHLYSIMFLYIYRLIMIMIISQCFNASFM